MSTKLLKATTRLNEINGPLAHIINTSFETGVVPKHMKIAKIIPVYKSTNQNVLNVNKK